jgi:predicted PurR-regulated permease PerM
MKNKLKKTIGSSLFIAAILLIISLAVLMPVLNMLLLGAVIAYGIRPLSNKIQSKIKFSSISTIISIIIVVIPLILIFAYTISVIMEFSYSFVSSNHISLNLNQYTNIVNKYLPSEIQSSGAVITTTINQIINDTMKIVFNYFLDFVKSLPIIMVKIFVLLSSTFYFVRDGHKIKEYVFSFIPEEREEFFSKMIIEIKTG